MQTDRQTVSDPMRNKTMHEAETVELSSSVRYGDEGRFHIQHALHLKLEGSPSCKGGRSVEKKEESFNTPAEFVTINPKQS